MPTFLSWLPRLPVSPELGLILSALIVSLAAGLFALIRNRRLIAASSDEAGDLGMLFDNPASILPHVMELRDRLIKSFIAIGIATLVALLLTDQLLAVMAQPAGGLSELQAIRVTEPFGVFFRISVVVGIILASPFVIVQLWIFIAAGLRSSERRWFYLFVPFAVLLFMIGVAFAYAVMLPVAVPFLLEFMGIQARPTLEDYVKFVTNVLLWVGISFEMPLVTFILAKAKLITARQLAQNWRIAIVIIAILAAVVTPTPDPINMGIVAAPLFVLYLLSIVLALFA
jgi:sec-independent protein translocase protein TatC